MRKITQTNGDNCLQAAVASILDLTLDEVPHFGEHLDWEIRFMDFMAEHDQPVTLVAYEGNVSGIACGNTIRNSYHAVVMRDGVQVWDPHPSRAGLLKVRHVYAV